MKHPRRRTPAKTETNFQQLHSSTAEAREFLTAAIARDYALSGELERAAPTLTAQLSDIWAQYIAFLLSDFGDEAAIDHWRQFCEYGAIRSELTDAQ